MIRFRSFRNEDPPQLLSVWQEQLPIRGLMQPMSNLLLEMFVLSKPYFDRHGLIVAVDAEETIVGFAHAGFGPNPAGTDLAKETGITCLLIAREHARRAEILTGLATRCEAYLRAAGVARLRVGGPYPLCPFYLGLSGGSDLQGVVASDSEMDQLYLSEGYEVLGHRVVMDRELVRFRPAMDRRIIQFRRQFRLVPSVNPNSDWWNACIFGPTDRICFQLHAKNEDEPCGQAIFWDMGPLATRAQSGGMGMIDFRIREDQRGQGLGTFLVSESLRQLQSSGIHRVETQAMADNLAALKILNRLNFAQIRRDNLYVKDGNPPSAGAA